ncbi:Peptidase S8/S53 subtilisin/kexin/sedolisin [Macrophomina phaseolina MS6]|uniref:tripeptidyl-peptidase II n=1 Tax=Macrophomina phaseolina (strain MS6) TaxID=1126212 RepID=K2QV12_MACPH|nr:Peptidase S8/S53 subtilisin/kexin/sedolisin [Macrophomina phaseolina MS6]
MRLSDIVAFSALLSGVVASPVSTHVLHEKRDRLPAGWTKRSRLDSRAVLPMRIALAQRNLHKAYDYLYEVSNPASEKFGKHWSAKEVAETFAPSSETVDTVKSWLTDAGIAAGRVKTSQGLNWIEFDATVEEAEALLKTEYHVYHHSISGQPHIAAEAYSLPAHVREHVDFVYPTVHFDAKVQQPKKKRSKRDSVPTVKPGVAHTIGEAGSGSLPKLGEHVNKDDVASDLAQCDHQIIPDCLRALYQFPEGSSANPENSYGIVEYTPQSYLPSDLDLFFANFSREQIGDRPIFDSIDGGVLQTIDASFNYNGESDLDLEYAMTLVYPLNVTLYQVGDMVEGASFNNFLDAIDGSYCTYKGGDDPEQDGIYPDPYPGVGAYVGPENCGGFAATKVISTSYGYNEADLTPAYEQRQCEEYMKLGLQGVTVLYSSGDYGVAGNGGQCIDPATGEYNSGNSGIFNPSFPASCPYITAVGATQVKPGVDIVDALATGTQPEEACETVIYSGGGFSNVFPLPDYQADAVKGWFADNPPPYGADRFNNSQQTRGFPDVSANGANYVIAIDGEFALVYGTSASSPTFGSVITLVNEERLKAGKGSVGFLNPTLYANPGVLNDITEGGNEGCGTPGFSSAVGWDPVTGLGTPNYPKLLELYLGLP